MARNNGLILPIVYNTSSYEKVDAIKMLINKVDNSIEDFDNKKAVEYLDKESRFFDRISELFNK